MIFISDWLFASEPPMFWTTKKYFLKLQNKYSAVPHGILLYLFQFCESDKIENLNLFLKEALSTTQILQAYNIYSSAANVPFKITQQKIPKAK